MDEVELLKSLTNEELVARLAVRSDLTARERVLLNRLERLLPFFTGRTLIPSHK